METTETKGLTRAQLRGKLAEHRVTHRQFAQAAHLHEVTLSNILRGAPVGSEVRGRIERAIKVLRLMEPAEDGSEKLIFRVTQL